jgi:hypothetical protein
VRVTVEGVVENLDAAGDFDIRTSAPEPFGVMVKDNDYEIEVLERRGYLPGTVVTSPAGSFVSMGRTAKGAWLNIHAGTPTIYKDKDIRRYVSDGELVVTHAPPA